MTWCSVGKEGRGRRYKTKASVHQFASLLLSLLTAKLLREMRLCVRFVPHKRMIFDVGLGLGSSTVAAKMELDSPLSYACNNYGSESGVSLLAAIVRHN